MKNVVRKFYWNQTYNGRVSAQCVLVLRLHSAQTLLQFLHFIDKRNGVDRMEENYDRLRKIHDVSKILNSATAKF